jgi:hypothetical protein
LLYRQNKQFEEWIKQAKEGCNIDQIWFLCIKSNRREPLVAADSVVLYDTFSRLNFTSYKLEMNYVYVAELKPFFNLAKDYLLSFSKNTVS